MRLRHLAPLLLLLAAAPAPRKAHPALWALSDADTTIYLFGTIHALPPGVQWRDPVIAAAMEKSDTLTLETVLDENPTATATLLLTMGRIEPHPLPAGAAQAGGLKAFMGEAYTPLAERVPAEKRARLEALIKASGVAPTLIDQLKSWAAAVILTGATMREIGIGAEDGVEHQLTAYFRERREPVDGLETPAQQFGFFDQLPEASQRRFLVATLDDPAKASKEFDALVAAWSKGDVAAIARAFADDPEFTPALRDLLVRRRNAAWALALRARLAKPGTSFVAVGAGHLAGKDSLIAMLQKQGLRVKRED